MRKILAFLFVLAIGITTQSVAQFTKLYDFRVTPPDAAGPFGDLLSDGTYLYGLGTSRGSNGYGNIFKIKTDGTNYQELHGFGVGTDGKWPFGSLASDGTFLYGMTYGGGADSDGIVFKVKPDGSGYTKLFDFNDSSGFAPNGSLVYDGTYLYGMTYGGGLGWGAGVVFKIMPDGSGYVKLHEFNPLPDGSEPNGSLFYDGVFLYGMTPVGGANNLGTIFKIKPDGSSYTRLLDFDGAANGSNPYGSLISDGTYLFGMTHHGGINDSGTVFKIKPDSTGFEKLFDFAGTTDGSSPWGSLVSDGTFLYGMTNGGGNYTHGTIFKIKADGTSYSKLFDFDLTNGSNVWGSLILEAGMLYGMTNGGGTHGYGVIFKYDLTTGINELAPFDSSIIISPNIFTGNLTIKSSATHSAATVVYLYDYTGKVIVSRKSFGEEIILNTEGIAAGIYLLRIEDGRGVKNYKIIKQ